MTQQPEQLTLALDPAPECECEARVMTWREQSTIDEYRTRHPNGKRLQAVLCRCGLWHLEWRTGE